MMFLLATDELVVAGRSYPGFPLLVDGDGGAIEPAQTFLWDHLSSGRRQNKLTWEKYGRALYDFFAYVYQNKLDWKAARTPGVPSAVESYRDWSKGELDLDPSVINQRLGLIAKFYEWAVKHGLATEIPFKLESVRTSRHPGFLAHVDTTGGWAQSLSIKLRQKKNEIKFLTKEQARVCLSQLDNETHRRMFELMVRTGLRQIECRTFPEKYLFDPTKRRDLVEGRMIRVHLDPRDMKTKYDKEREIDMPYALMEDLWWYSVRQRVKRERMQPDGKTYSTLFLNELRILPIVNTSSARS